MARSYLLLGTPNQSNASGSTTYWWPLAYTLTKGTTTAGDEASWFQLPYKKAITLSRLDLNIATNSTTSGTNALTVRKNGADSTLLINTIPYNTTGWMTPDTTHTVDYNGSTDWGSLKMQIGAPVGSNRLKVGTINIACDTADSETWVQYQNRGPELSTGPRYGSLCQGAAWGSTYNAQDTKTYFDFPCTVRNAQVQWAISHPTDSRWLRLLKNGVATSIAIEIPRTSTGLHTDLYATTGHEVTLAAGDYIGWEIDTDGDTTFTGGAGVSIEVTSTTGQQTVAGHWGTSPNYPAGAGPWYNPLGSVQGAIVTSATGQQNRFYGYPEVVIDKLRAHVKTNSLTGAPATYSGLTVYTQQNGADTGLSINIPVNDGNDKDYSDTSNSVSLTGNETVGWKMSMSAATGELVMTHVSARLTFIGDQIMHGTPASAGATATSGSVLTGGQPAPIGSTSASIYAQGPLFDLQVWSGYECDGGVRTGVVTSVYEGTLTLSLDNTDELTFTVPNDEAYLSGLAVRNVIRCVAPEGTVTEWRVINIEHATGFDQPAVRIRALSPIIEMSTVLLRETATSLPSAYDLGGVDLTPQGYIEGFVLPSLEADGIDYFAVGSMGSTDLMTIAWDRWTPMQLLNEIASKTGLELRIRRNGSTNYLIDLVTQVGSAGQNVPLQLGRNIRTLSRLLEAQDLSTVVVPFGDKVVDDVESSTMGEAVWEITGKSGNDLTLADIAGGDDPIAYDDQLDGYYLVRMEDEDDASAITATDAATQTVTVASGTAFSVGDWVGIAKDTAFTPVDELSNPAAVTAYGTVRAFVEFPDERNERNWLRNPTAEGTANTRAFGGTVSSVGSYDSGNDWTPVTFQFPQCTSADILTGSFVRTQTGTAGLQAGRATATDETTDGSGNVTLYFAGDHTTGTPPSGWALVWCYDFAMTDIALSATQTYAKDKSGAMWQRAYADGKSLSGAVNGAQSSVFEVLCDGFPAGATVHAGDLLCFNSASYYISGATRTADGSGNITLFVLSDTGTSPLTFTDNHSVVVTHPVASTTPLHSTSRALVRPCGVSTAYDCALYYGPVTLRYDAARNNTWWVHVGLQHLLATYSSLDVSSHYHANLALYKSDGGWSLVGGSVSSSYDSLSRGFTDEILRGSVSVSADKIDCYARVYPWSATSGTPYNAGPWTVVTFVMLTNSVHSDVDFCIGAWGTRLWQRANTALAKLSQPRAVYALQLDDRASRGESDETLALGAYHRLIDTALGVDTDVRAVVISRDLVQPIMDVAVDSAPRELTKTIAGIG